MGIHDQAFMGAGHIIAQAHYE